MQPAYEIITNRIIEQLEKGVIPWQKPWKSGLASCNFISKHEYQGINRLMTNMMGYTSPFWLTFNQAKTLKGSIKAKERGTPIIYFDIKEKEVNGVMEKFIMVKYSTIFNLEQTTLELPVVEPVTKEFAPIEVAEQIVTNYANGPRIEYKDTQTYYVPSTDTVNMLQRHNYLSPEHYYYCLYHELSHSTGHHSRLNREGISSDGLHSKHSYSYEELIAELSSSFLLNAIGLDFIQQHSSYISGWLSVLKNDAKFVIKAASEAERSANYILGERAVAIPKSEESSAIAQ